MKSLQFIKFVLYSLHSLYEVLLISIILLYSECYFDWYSIFLWNTEMWYLTHTHTIAAYNAYNILCNIINFISYFYIVVSPSWPS